jgi:PAS domain S-box-containing protein
MLKTLLQFLQKPFTKGSQEVRIDFARSPLGMAVVDARTGQFHQVNPVFARFLGIAPEVLMQTSWPQLLQMDGGAGAFSVQAPPFVTDAHVAISPFMQNFRRADGGSVSAEITVLAVHPHHERYTCTLLIQDVTQRLQAEEQLRVSDRRHRLLADSGRDVVWTMSPMGEITYISPAIEQLRGISPQEAMKMPIEETLTPASQKVSLGYFQDLFLALQEGKPLPSFRDNLEYYRKDGSTFWTEVLSFPLLGADGSLVEIVGVTRDISERRLYEDSLRQAREAAELANQTKSEFLAHISHEIRTPMSAILALTDLTLSTDLTAQQREYLVKSKNAGNLLQGIINDILDLSRMESGQFELTAQPFALSNVLQQVSDLVIDTCALKGLAYAVEVAKDVPQTYKGDATRIAQALLNMVGNAVKFTDQGRVDVRVKCLRTDLRGVHLEFAVQDTGPGLDADFQVRAFEGFVRGDNEQTRLHGGTGLGLSITRRLAQKMGGDVGVSSTPGQGATFWFTVCLSPCEPLIQAPPQDAAYDAKRKALLKGVRVLLVEDNASMRSILTQLLALTGVVVELAENGVEALHKLEEAAYQLVLMDMQMPLLNGWDTTRLIRENPAHNALPIVAITASGFDQDRERCLEVGMNDYLTKPFQYNELLDVLYRNLSPQSSA